MKRKSKQTNELIVTMMTVFNIKVGELEVESGVSRQIIVRIRTGASCYVGTEEQLMAGMYRLCAKKGRGQECLKMFLDKKINIITSRP